MGRTLAALVVLAALVAAQAGAVEPAGPRLAIVTQDYCCESELITVGPSGQMSQQAVVQLASERPSWSADGSSLALAVVSGVREGAVVAVSQITGALRVYRPAILDRSSDPVISPDGRTVAFSRARLVKVLPGRENYLFKSSIWLLDVKSGSMRRLTRWRLANYLFPSSFSPDGSKLATSVVDRHGFRAVAIDLRSSRFTLLAREALEPTYSPDGSRFAFVRWKNWRLSGNDEGIPGIDELRIGRVGAVTGSRLLLRRRSYLAWPSWDPSGQRLVFTQSKAEEVGDRSPQAGNRLMAINADGTCLTRVFADPELTLYGAAWQPGPGREAGPIVC